MGPVHFVKTAISDRVRVKWFTGSPLDFGSHGPGHDEQVVLRVYHCSALCGRVRIWTGMTRAQHNGMAFPGTRHVAISRCPYVALSRMTCVSAAVPRKIHTVDQSAWSVAVVPFLSSHAVWMDVLHRYEDGVLRMAYVRRSQLCHSELAAP